MVIYTLLQSCIIRCISRCRERCIKQLVSLVLGLLKKRRRLWRCEDMEWNDGLVLTTLVDQYCGGNMVIGVLVNVNVKGSVRTR